MLEALLDPSPSVAELFTQIHYVRLVFVEKDAAEFGKLSAQLIVRRT